MEKPSNSRMTMVVGLITAVATVCAAVIGGIFAVVSARMNQTGSPTVVITVPPPTVGPVDTPISEAPWEPGAAHATHPHVIASENNGKWVPDIGYAWANPDDDSDFTVVWDPGQADPDNPNVVASDTEGNWVPASGYKWCNPDDENDLTTCRVQGTIESVEVEHNVMEGDQKGMRIHVKFTVEELQDIRCHIGAYFYDASGNPLSATSSLPNYNANGYVFVGTDFIPNYRSTLFEDFVLFIPINALNIDPNLTQADLKFIVRLYNWRDETYIAESSEYTFSFTR